MADKNKALLESGWIQDIRKDLSRNPEKRWSRRDPSEIKGVVYHQSLDDKASAKGLARYHAGPNHISKTGLPTISYTLFVGFEGEVQLCNDVEDVTLSQGDASKPGDENKSNLAICFAGNFDGPGHQGTQKPSSGQIETAKKLWILLKGMFGLKNAQLYGHFNFGKPACPGTILQQLIEEIQKTQD